MSLNGQVFLFILDSFFYIACPVVYNRSLVVLELEQEVGW